MIAYYSWSGNTKSVAEKIHAQIGGDMFRIETKDPYPKDYNETAYGVAKEQHDKGIIPELKENIEVSEHDIIFVGHRHGGMSLHLRLKQYHIKFNIYRYAIISIEGEVYFKE